MDMIEKIEIKDAFELHRKFTKKISEIVEAMIKLELADGERVQYCNVTAWSHFTHEETQIWITGLSCRIECDEEAEGERFSVRYGCAFREPKQCKESFGFPARWLLNSDEWESEYRVMKRDHDLRIAKFRLDSAVEHLADLKKRVKDAEKSVSDLSDKVKKLKGKTK